MSYKEYYMQQYHLEIQDSEQPLLVWIISIFQAIIFGRNSNVENFFFSFRRRNERELKRLRKIKNLAIFQEVGKIIFFFIPGE